MNLVLEFDDFHWLHPENCLDSIYYLIKIHPAIKISLFTVPCLRGRNLNENKEWCDNVRKLIESNNIQLCVHGLTHSQEEFKHKNYLQALNSLSIALQIFHSVNLPVAKVFRGPHWGLNEESVKALIDLNFTHIYNHYDYKHLYSDNIKFIYYNWNLKDNFLGGEGDIIAHGHTHNVCQNGIFESLDQISNFIKMYSPIFKFANEL